MRTESACYIQEQETIPQEYNLRQPRDHFIYQQNNYQSLLTIGKSVE